MLFIAGWLFIVAATKLQKLRKSKTSDTDSTSDESVVNVPRWKEVAVIAVIVLTYMLSVFMSWLLEYFDLKYHVVVLSLIYCFGFMLISFVGGSFLLQILIPMTYSPPKVSK